MDGWKKKLNPTENFKKVGCFAILVPTRFGPSHSSQVRTVSAAHKKIAKNLGYAQLFFDILGT